MRLAYICNDLNIPIFGRTGPASHVRETVHALVRAGVEVDLFTPFISAAAPPGLENVRRHLIPVAPSDDEMSRVETALASNLELRSLLWREGPFDAVYERQSTWCYAGMEYARSTGVPGLLEVNAPLPDGPEAWPCQCDQDSARVVAERAFSMASRLIAVSAPLASYLETWPACRGKVRVVPNGVHVERFPLDRKPAIPKRKGVFTVGFVGTCDQRQSWTTLLEAFRKLRGAVPDTRLLIVGDGAQRSAWYDDVRSHQLQLCVHFTGAVTPDEVPDYLASMDVAVAPYATDAQYAGSPLKVLECMAAGLPVIATGQGQILEMIDHGRTGLLVKPGDAGALAAQLLRVQQAPAWAAKLGRAARASCRRSHCLNRVTQKLLRLAGVAPLPATRAFPTRMAVGTREPLLN